MKVNFFELGEDRIFVLVPDGYNWMTLQVAYGEICIVDFEEAASRPDEELENWFVVKEMQAPLELSVRGESTVCFENSNGYHRSFLNIIWSRR